MRFTVSQKRGLMVGTVLLVFSLLGSIFLVFGFVPQAIKTFRTKHTSNLSLLMWVLIDIACVFFVVYGVSFVGKYSENTSTVSTNLIPGLSLIISNLLVLFSSLVVSIIKIDNLLKSKKYKISEEEVGQKKLKKIEIGSK